MSGQWEVVGKKRDKINKNVTQLKAAKELNKKAINNVKIEDVLAKSQVKNLYSNDKNKENKVVEKKSQENGPTKKVAKKPEKSAEVVKPKPPKSIESALLSINVDDFKEILEKSKNHFPDAPIVWLKDLAQFLNQKISLEIQDPVFSNKPNNYPISVMPTVLKNVIDKALKLAGKENVKLFFDISLTAMATDMAKNLPAIGHKLFLQHIASTEKSLVIANLSKHIVLRNSYQNRPNIGSSILWAVGQAGLDEFQTGIKVFQELMLPLIEMKNYSRLIAKYLLDVVKGAKDVPVTKENYTLLLETVYSNKKNFPNDLKQELILAINGLKPLVFHKNNKEKSGAFVEYTLKKIANNHSNNQNKAYVDQLCDILIDCFHKDHTSLEVWSKVYYKNVTASAVQLNYIEKNWKTVSNRLNCKAFANVLSDFADINAELLQKKKKEEGLVQSVASIQKLLDGINHNEKKSRSWLKIFIFFTIFVAGFLLYYDIKVNGNWEGSNTKNKLAELGALEHINKVLVKGKEGLSYIDIRVEKTFPGYKKTIADISEPYLELMKNLGIVIYNLSCNIKEAFVEQYPHVVKSIETYIPGLVEMSQNAVSNAWTTSVFYINRSVDYLRKEVFVGQLSPENMQRVVIEAINTTQLKATEYYHWLYEKVQTAIK